MKILIRPCPSLLLRACRLILVACSLLPSSWGYAQVTTGSITGTVADTSGGVLPGATVSAVHVDTGVRQSTVTDADGRFSLVNLPAGGPYTVTAQLQGFAEGKVDAVTVPLGGGVASSFRLKIQAVSETIEVVAQTSLMGPTTTGPASNVGREAIEALPTIARGLEDFARTNPFFVSAGGGQGDGASALSVGGRNSKYNNVQIDGAVNNDVYGLADSGAPGGQTEAQPVSLDAIQEIQLVVAPYDVRQGGFTGGGLNAVTRSGTNRFRGTAYYYFRNKDTAGPGPCPAAGTCPSDASRKLTQFSDAQFGASLGGPLRRNKAFFFLNADFGRKETPTGFSASGSGGANWLTVNNNAVRASELARILATAQARYGYNPGSLDEFARAANNNKLIGKIDIVLSDRHRLTFRHNFVDGDNDIGTPSNTQYRFPDAFFELRSRTHSTVAQLNSTLGGGFNELRLAYTTVRDQRDGTTAFPAVRVDLSDTSSVFFGRETFSTANELDQDVVELTNDFTLPRGRHTFILGTHNEFFKFRNLFIRDNFGSYRFSSVANFEAGLAQQYDYSFSATSDPRQPAAFSVRQFGVRLGDIFRASSRLTLTYGITLDLPRFPDKPHANPAALATFGFATDVVPSPAMVSPRIGFNYDMGGQAKRQIRGGAGLFSGRTPYVWLSNQYGNTGIDFTRVGAAFNTANRIPFVSNIQSQAKVVTGAASGAFSNEVDFVDPDFKYPQNLKATLGYDQELGVLGLVGIMDLAYSKNVSDIFYSNLNFSRGPSSRPDGRPVMVRNFAQFSDIILLSNTSKGYQWNASVRVERPFRQGWSASAAYSYGDAFSTHDGTSSQAASNWGNAYTRGDPNTIEVMRSRFAAGHRVQASMIRNFTLGGGATFQLGAYYEGASGRPYHFTVPAPDWNGDGRTTNDLLYVPRSPDEVTVVNGTWEQLDAFVEADRALRKSRGQIMQKHAAWGPWTHGLDLSGTLGLTVAGRKLEVRGDLQNALNLLNDKWGVRDFATFGDLSPIPVTLNAATGKAQYNLATINSPTFIKYDRDSLRSRWIAQLSARVRF